MLSDGVWLGITYFEKPARGMRCAGQPRSTRASDKDAFAAPRMDIAKAPNAHKTSSLNRKSACAIKQPSRPPRHPTPAPPASPSLFQYHPDRHPSS